MTALSHVDRLTYCTPLNRAIVKRFHPDGTLTQKEQSTSTYFCTLDGSLRLSRPGMAQAAWKRPTSMADAAIDLGSEGQESVALVTSFHSSIPVEFEWMAEDSKFIHENPTSS